MRLAVEVLRRAGARRPARSRSRASATSIAPSTDSSASMFCGGTAALRRALPSSHGAARTRPSSVFASTTIVLTGAITPGATSISTMCVPSSRIGSSRRTLALVDAEPARLLDRVDDLLRGHRAEQAAVLAGLVGDREHGLGQQRGGLLRRAPPARVPPALPPRTRALGGRDRGGGRGLGELAGARGSCAGSPGETSTTEPASPSPSTSLSRIA